MHLLLFWIGCEPCAGRADGVQEGGGLAMRTTVMAGPLTMVLGQ